MGQSHIEHLDLVRQLAENARRDQQIEAIFLMGEAVQGHNDPRIKDVLASSKNGVGELVIWLKNGRVLVIRSSDIADYADTEYAAGE